MAVGPSATAPWAPPRARPRSPAPRANTERPPPSSAAAVGYVPGSELFVWVPSTLARPEGDGAVQLVTVACDHFDPGETIYLGIDVDGFADFHGVSPPPPLAAGALVAMGQAVVEGEGQVYFDIVAADEAPPQAVPAPVPWILTGGLLVAAWWRLGNRNLRSRRFW